MKYINKIKYFFTELIFKCYHYLVIPLRYKIQVVGLEKALKQRNDPKRGILFLCNHPTHLDASLVGTSLVWVGEQMSVWSMDFVYKNAYARMCARQPKIIRMLKVPNAHEQRSHKNSMRVRKLIRRTIEGLEEGENVLFFPAGYQKFTAREEVNGKSAVQRILKLYPNVNIVMVRISGMWGSRFSKAVKKSDRSNLRNGNWINFIWSIFKIIVLNMLFFIPKRKVKIEFETVGPSFPRQGTRREINQYLEDFFNRSYGRGGEPLQRVPDYFWKSQYSTHEYHVKCYHFDLDKIPEKIQTDVLETISKQAKMPPEDISTRMLLDRDLCLDSLEITEIFIELEKKYQMPLLVPKDVSTVGHLMALAAGIPVEYVPVRGEFSVVQEEIAPVVRAWQVCLSVMASVFSILDIHK